MENDRTTAASLRVPDRSSCGFMACIATEPHSHFSPIRSMLPPPGAPNVRIVMLDDVGFSTASTYGETCATPTEDRLAAAGLRFIRFRTTAPCSPMRAAILSGRNHHTAGMGGITQRLFLGTTGRNDHSVIDTKNKSRNFTDAVAISQSNSRNIIKGQGGGWALSVDGGSRLGRGASVTALVDDSPVAAGHVDHTQPAMFLGTKRLTSASITDRTSRTGTQIPTAASAGRSNGCRSNPNVTVKTTSSPPRTG